MMCFIPLPVNSKLYCYSHCFIEFYGAFCEIIRWIFYGIHKIWGMTSICHNLQQWHWENILMLLSYYLIITCDFKGKWKFYLTFFLEHQNVVKNLFHLNIFLLSAGKYKSHWRCQWNWPYNRINKQITSSVKSHGDFNSKIGHFGL